MLRAICLVISVVTVSCELAPVGADGDAYRSSVDLSVCEDMETFLQFRQTYDVARAIANANLFRGVDNIGNIIYDCNVIFSSKEETESIWPPLKFAEIWEINPQYIDDLRMGDPNVILRDFYTKNLHNHGTGFSWLEDYLEGMARGPCTCGQYGQPHCEEAFRRYEHFIRDKHGVIVGSQVPWAEAASIRFGATKVTTIEYMPIATTHPKHVAYTPNEAAAKYLSKTMELADYIITFSSVEHDGLGRYGDPLNAFGDLESIAKMHCLLKEGGILFFAVPVGQDDIHYNAHRIYGYRRLSVVLALGFRIIDIVNDKPFRMDVDNKWHTQPIFVLQKI